MTHYANVTAIRPALEGVYVTLSCHSCAENFERFLATVAGLAFGRFACPNCHAMQEIFPDNFVDTLENLLPMKAIKELYQLNKEANRIAENWYRIESLAQLFSYRDVNLGEPTERALFFHISLGLYLVNSVENKSKK